MQPTMRGAFTAGIGILLAAHSPANASDRPRDNVVAVTRSFLTAYANGDDRAVLSEVDPQVVVYGSDSEEVFHGVAGVRRMLHADHRLWGGPASIGDMRDVSLVTSGQLSAITFHAPFVLRGGPPVLVRFSMVWKHGLGGWRLVQSANSTPTVGQSAEALLKAQR